MQIGNIEKNVGIPAVHSRFVFPWEDMEVNDSVFVGADKGETLFNLKRKVGPSARYYGNVTNKTFKTLMVREDNGVRVWRLS